MARADVNEPHDVVLDAVDLLTRDHRLVEELFAAFDQAAPQQLDPLARRVCKMLRIHAQIEEEILYPIARRAVGDDVLIDDAQREHADARQSIARVESMTSDDSGFKEAVSALAAQIAEHVDSEEHQLFPQLRDRGVNLAFIGLTLAERRDTLLDTLGLHSDDEEGAANQRDAQQPSTAGRPSI